jgi:hypothetical protein
VKHAANTTTQTKVVDPPLGGSEAEPPPGSLDNPYSAGKLNTSVA